MEFLTALHSVSLVGTLFFILSFVAALVIIVFVHEFGHFIVGRWCGVKVEAFSIGFGKELFGFTDRHGTRWKFCPIQLGGYVRFEGDANAASMPDNSVAASQSPTSLQAQPVWERMAVVAAGPITNFLFAIAIFTVAFMAIGLPYMRPTVGEVLPGSAAAVAGIVPGDTITRVDGKTIFAMSDVQEAFFLRPNETFDIVVQRKGQPLTLSVTPKAVEQKDSFGGSMKVGQLGIRHVPEKDEPLFQRFSAPEAMAKAMERTWFTISSTATFFKKVITGQQSVKQIGGAVSIAKGAGDAAAGGVLSFCYFLGFLSISIGIVNLFPIPMLDGGHLVFYAIEAIRGKPVGPAAQEWGFRIGFSCVVMLMLLGLFNDAGRVVNVVFGT